MQLLGLSVLQSITRPWVQELWPACTTLQHYRCIERQRTAPHNWRHDRILKLVILFLGRSKLYRHHDDDYDDDGDCDDDDETVSRAEYKAV
jgi:hypothetical protein